MLNKRNNENEHMAGLYGMPIANDENESHNEISAVAIPLKGVRVMAKVHDFIAEVQVIQCYQNNTHVSTECTYHFPLDDQAAVCGFQAEYEDGTIVKGKVREKNEALSEYKRAVKQGKQANLLQQAKPDIFTINVGNLPPGNQIKITITYVTTLEAREDAMAFVLPTCVAPRFTPKSDNYLSPSEAAAVHADTVGFEPLLGLAVNVQFTCKSSIHFLQSPTHQEEEGRMHSHCHLDGNKGTFLIQNVPLDRDLVILCQEERPHQPHASVEVGPDGSLVGLVSLFPQIEFRDRPREFIFLLDRSGSMSINNQIGQAKDALLLFLRGLPMNSTFNIVGFGSRYKTMFARPQPYNDDTLEYATNQVSSMHADLGGTEIFAPLQEIFHKPLSRMEERQVFVLTDGQVSNNTQIFDLIRTHCSSDGHTAAKSRVFCVGVGNNVSRNLCNGMARAGNGTVRFVEEGGPSLQSKLMGQLKQALQPRLDNVTVKWDMPVEKGMPSKAKKEEQEQQPSPNPVKTLLGYRSPNVNDVLLNTNQQERHPMRPRLFPSVGQTVFNKERLLSFAIFPRGSPMPKSVTVSCMTEDGLLETNLAVAGGDRFRGLVAHKLAAKKAIQEYEDREGGDFQQDSVLTRADALEMALTNSLASQLTSFIAIMEKKQDGELGTLDSKLPSACARPNTKVRLEGGKMPAPQWGDDMDDSDDEDGPAIVSPRMQRSHNGERCATDLQEEDATRGMSDKLNAFWAKQQRRQLERSVCDQRNREAEKLSKIQRELDSMEKRRFMVALGYNANFITDEQLNKSDIACLHKEHVDKIHRKKAEAEYKAKKAAKELDHLVRATRVVELPLIKAKYEEKKKADREHYEAEKKKIVAEARMQWENDMKDRSALADSGVFDYLAMGKFQDECHHERHRSSPHSGGGDSLGATSTEWDGTDFDDEFADLEGKLAAVTNNDDVYDGLNENREELIRLAELASERVEKAQMVSGNHKIHNHVGPPKSSRWINLDTAGCSLWQKERNVGGKEVSLDGPGTMTVTPPTTAKESTGTRGEPFDLCILQKANGSFLLTQQMFTVLNISQTKLDSLWRVFFSPAVLSPAAPPHRSTTLATAGTSNNNEHNGAASTTVFATLLALSAFRCLFSVHQYDRSIWDLNEGKALYYLKNTCGLSDREIEGHVFGLRSCLLS